MILVVVSSLPAFQIGNLAATDGIHRLPSVSSIAHCGIYVLRFATCRLKLLISCIVRLPSLCLNSSGVNCALSYRILALIWRYGLLKSFCGPVVVAVRFLAVRSCFNRLVRLGARSLSRLSFKCPAPAYLDLKVCLNRTCFSVAQILSAPIALISLFSQFRICASLYDAVVHVNDHSHP